MNVDAYILIGGSSKRFGSDKATFLLDGTMLAERSAKVADTASLGSRITFVAARAGQFVAIDERRMIFDVRRGYGAIGAVYTALMDATTEWTFVLACDLPFVSPLFIKHLRSYADGGDAAVPVQIDGHWQPLCAFYRTEPCRTAFETALIADGRVPSLRSVIDTLDTRVVTFEEYSWFADAAKLLRNVNTPAELTFE